VNRPPVAGFEPTRDTPRATDARADATVSVRILSPSFVSDSGLVLRFRRKVELSQAIRAVQRVPAAASKGSRAGGRRPSERCRR